MKPRHQFATLSEQDQNHILELCSRYPYERVVPMLKKPRSEGGLSLVTSRSALCRFFTSSTLDTPGALLAQHAAAANIRHEQNSNAFLGAIRASVEARVLENLHSGKALADLEKDFKLLKTAQALYLDDAKWRAQNPKAARAAYKAHVECCANAPDIDFVPTETLEQTGSLPYPRFAIGDINESQPPLPARAGETSPANFDEPSEFEQDVIKARLEQKLRAEQRDQLLAALGQNSPCGEHFPGVPNLPRPDLQKTPAIPHFPLNPASPNRVPAMLAQPGCAEPPASSQKPPSHENQTTTKPVPHLRVAPKAGRNDPCPCGSGRKYKRCCETAAGSIMAVSAKTASDS